jgi:hypothetical protein
MDFICHLCFVDLASFVASSSNRLLGICGHPSSTTQSNIWKTLIVAFGVLSDASTFLWSPFSCVSFGVPISTNC